MDVDYPEKPRLKRVYDEVGIPGSLRIEAIGHRLLNDPVTGEIVVLVCAYSYRFASYIYLIPFK